MTGIHIGHKITTMPFHYTFHCDSEAHVFSNLPRRPRSFHNTCKGRECPNVLRPHVLLSWLNFLLESHRNYKVHELPNKSENNQI